MIQFLHEQIQAHFKVQDIEKNPEPHGRSHGPY